MTLLVRINLFDHIVLKVFVRKILQIMIFWSLSSNFIHYYSLMTH